MDIQKINYFEKVENEIQQQFIENHNHCALCGTVLELSHKAAPEDFEIKEEARCPECDIRARVKTYSLN